MADLVICKRCKVAKARDQFWRHCKNSNGLQAYCKPCATASARNYVRTPEANRRHRESSKAANRLRWRAHKIISLAIQRGALTRQPCEVCGAERAEAHHPDYSKPYEVRWLCRPHHMAHHAELRALEADAVPHLTA